MPSQVQQHGTKPFALKKKNKIACPSPTQPPSSRVRSFTHAKGLTLRRGHQAWGMGDF